MMKKSMLFILFALLSLYGNANEDNIQPHFLYELANQSEQWFEGFQKNIGGNEFSYNSFRNDVSKSLITRCTNGNMAIEWETAAIPNDWSEKTAGFLWITALDLTPDKFVFDVYVNGVKRFEIPSSNQEQWNIESKDGGSLSFLTVETDRNGDAHGYMWLTAPENWIEKGKAQRIKIVGRAEGSNTWVIVYQANDALSFLQGSVKYNVCMHLDMQKNNKQIEAKLTAPLFYTGQTVDYKTAGHKHQLTFTNEGDKAQVKFTLPLSGIGKEFVLSDKQGELFIINKLGENEKPTQLFLKSILTNETQAKDNHITITAKRKYQPKIIPGLLTLSKSNLSKGQILLINSSHQDIAWMDSPEKCVIERDTMLLTPLFEMIQKNPDYRFDIEDALMLKEYVERHPDKKELIKTMLKNGQISCGSSFTQPYEEMYSDESLARQFYFGTKWLKDEFDYNATVYWNEDVPGRTLQMMQLMRKAGTKYMMISRHEKGFYNWYSPDSSYVTVFTPGHYGANISSLQRDTYDAIQYIADGSLFWEKYYNKKSNSPIIPLLSDNDMSPANNYNTLISGWGKIKKVQTENGKQTTIKLPQLEYATTPEFFSKLENVNPNIPSIHGERPDVWLYIHGPSHQKALKASREGDILLTMAEKFATINSLIDSNFKNYPTKQLNNAWKAKIYPDHGWGGKNGDITDNVFLQKFLFAKSEAEKILSESLNEIASKINTKKGTGRPLVVFNSLNWSRTDPVEKSLTFDNGEAFSVTITNEKGEKQPAQLTQIHNYTDGSIQSATLRFTAQDVPSVGYKTYYMQTSSAPVAKKTKMFTGEANNQFYRLKFANGGLSSIYDKALGIELIDSTKFVAGEIFTMHSEGNGAGEFIDVQHPDTIGFDKTGNYNTKWEITEDGDVCTVYEYRQKIRNAVVEQKIRLYHHQKRIDFETALLNWEGVLYREYRMALPLNIQKGQVSYEVPFGVVKVGKDELEGAAGERYITPCKGIHPRGIENWISAGNNDFCVTMSSSVAVADWIDPTENQNYNPVLQPILIASRKSCHGEGNEYLQTGNHYFSFSITSHNTSEKNIINAGRQANEELHAVWAERQYANANLPESMSFFKTDQPNVFVSCIKKAEGNNDIVIRLVEMEGKNKQVIFECYKNINQAKQTNLIEEDVNDIKTNGKSVILNLGHHSIETIKLK